MGDAFLSSDVNHYRQVRPMVENSKNRALLRQIMLKKRKNLSHSELTQAAIGLTRYARGCIPLLLARNVLSHAPLAGEISPGLLQKNLGRAQFFEPRITHFNHAEMRFYKAENRKTCNKWGMLEPAAIGKPMPPKQLDVVLLPLVAFDRSGNRLGMGAGFYDRAFSFRLDNLRNKRPFLLGIAHHFQEVKSLDTQAWDVPLDAILTDLELIKLDT